MRGNLSKAGVQGIQGVKGDTPNIKFEYNEETGELSYYIDGVVLGEGLVQSNELIQTILGEIAALRQEIQKAFKRRVMIDLPAEKWEGSDNRYYQKVEIKNTTPQSQVELQPNEAQLEVFREKEIAFVVENHNGDIYVFCIGQKPMNDYTMQATVMEVVDDE